MTKGKCYEKNWNVKTINNKYNKTDFEWNTDAKNKIMQSIISILLIIITLLSIR